MTHGKLYLIPNFLSPQNSGQFIPEMVKKSVQHIKHFVVETPKPARALIKHLMLKHKQDDLKLWELNEHTKDNQIHELLEAMVDEDCGLITDAGLPCIADPGYQLVKLAQTKNIQVIPLPGASSIFMALMASGFNGQQFCFNGYLPVDKVLRAKKIKDLEQLVIKFGQTQIFMEAPYRNNQLLDDLIKNCYANTGLCIAANITAINEFIVTKTLKAWALQKPDLHKIPVMFVMGN